MKNFKYHTKVREMIAVQFTGTKESLLDVIEFTIEHPQEFGSPDEMVYRFQRSTNNGRGLLRLDDMRVEIGEWIVVDERNRYHVVADAAFRECYVIEDGKEPSRPFRFGDRVTKTKYDEGIVVSKSATDGTVFVYWFDQSTSHEDVGNIKHISARTARTETAEKKPTGPDLSSTLQLRTGLENVKEDSAAASQEDPVEEDSSPVVNNRDWYTDNGRVSKAVKPALVDGANETIVPTNETFKVGDRVFARDDLDAKGTVTNLSGGNARNLVVFDDDEIPATWFCDALLQLLPADEQYAKYKVVESTAPGLRYVLYCKEGDGAFESTSTDLQYFCPVTVPDTEIMNKELKPLLDVLHGPSICTKTIPVNRYGFLDSLWVSKDTPTTPEKLAALHRAARSV